MINNTNSCAEPKPLLCHGIFPLVYNIYIYIYLLTVFCRGKVLLNDPKANRQQIKNTISKLPRA